MRLLLVNPNTSSHITDRLAASARRVLAPADTLTALTAATGPAVVRTADDLRQAEAGLVALVTPQVGAHDALLLAISLDGGVTLLRAAIPELPAVGMTEAGLLTACLAVERVGLLTIGPQTVPLYQDVIRRIGVGSRVVAIEAPTAPAAYGPGAATVEPALTDTLVEAVERLRRAGAQAVVLAGAVLCGYAAAIEDRTGLPAFDGVTCAVGQLRTLLARRAAA